MSDEKGRIQMIKDLYNELKFEDDIEQLKEDEKTIVYQKNKDISEEILTLIDHELQNDVDNVEALFWKIKIYNGPYYEDTSIILSVAQEIIERFKDDTENVLKAYDWLAWGYDKKLELPTKAIEILHDKLIEISMIKGDYSLQDREFGETYYLIARLYKEMEDFDTAASFYLLACEHYPDHYYATYQGGMLFLERKDFDTAFAMLDNFFTFHGNEYSANIAKQIEEYHTDGSLGERWDYLYLMYCIGLSYPTQMGAKSTKEFGMKYINLIDDALIANPDNTFALRMKGRHYVDVDRNTKKAFEMLDRYYDITKTIVGSLYFEYFELGKKLNIDVHAKNFKIESEGFYGYNVMTCFLEKAGELKEQGAYTEALVYYKIAREIGLETYPIIQLYLKEGKGNKLNNNKHGYAMLCNNLGIAIRNIELIEETDYSSDACKLALQLHQEGYEYSPFWENLDSSMRLADAMKEFDKVQELGTEFLTYYDAYSISWMVVQRRLLKNLINADKHDEAEKAYFDLRFGFESQKIENEEIISEMILSASEFFTYLRFVKSEYENTIKLTEDFFSNPIYFDLNEEVSYINYWFSLAWCYYGLNNREKAQYYYDLMCEKYDGNENYQDAINEIPREYSLSLEERVSYNKLLELVTKEPLKLKNYPLNPKATANVEQLSKLLEYLNVLPEKFISVTLNNAINYEVMGRSFTVDSDEDNRYDTWFDIYMPNENITIRYNLIDTKLTQNILSFFNKKKRKQNVFVFFYYYEDGSNKSTSYKDFEDASKAHKALAQAEWNRVMSNLIDVVK